MGRRTARALITPSVLVWARRTSRYGLGEAAAKIEVEAEKLEAWEGGQDAPTVAQLKKIAAVYHRPLAVFYMPAPPSDFSVPHDFRRLPKGESRELSPELAFELRRLHEMRLVASELGTDEAVERPGTLGAADLGDDPAEVADHLRRRLGVTLTQQTTCASDYAALGLWRRAIESHGVLVAQVYGVDLHEMRALSITAERFPLVAVNVRDTPRARIFSLLHELGHVVLNSSGLCAVGDAAGSSVDRKVEQFCNAVAGQLVVPKRPLLEVVDATGRPAVREWEDSEIERLARRFWVSREVILRRLLELGRTTRSFYRNKRAQYEAAVEAAAEEEERRSGFSLPWQKSVSSRGRLYSRIVLDALDRDDITLSEASAYLNLKVTHFDDVRKAAFAEAAGQA